MSTMQLLYKRILSAHKHLPSPMRELGDTYVRREFRIHAKKANDSHKSLFFKEWESYLRILDEQRQSGITGKPMSNDQRKLLNDDQKEKLKMLKSELTTSPE
jgi:Complex1_LYR-like